MLNTSLARLSTGSVGGLSSPTVNLNRTRLRLQNLVFYRANACSDRKVMQLAGLYEEVFRNLRKEQTRGFSSLSIEDTQTWLQERKISRRGNVQFLGLELPREMAIALGSIAIVILQFYTYIHLKETRRRMRKLSIESPPTNEPWIVLYEGTIAWIASIGIVVAPAAGAAITGFGDGVVTEKEILEILSTSVTVLLSIFLATCSGIEIYKIRSRKKQENTD